MTFFVFFLFCLVLKLIGRGRTSLVNLCGCDGGQVLEHHVGFGEVNLEAGFGEPFVLTTVEVVFLTVGEDVGITIVEMAILKKVHVDDHRGVEQGDIPVEQRMGFEVKRAPWGFPCYNVHSIDLLNGVVLVKGLHLLEVVVDSGKRTVTTDHDFLEGLGVSCAESAFDEGIEDFFRDRTAKLDNTLEGIGVAGDCWSTCTTAIQRIGLFPFTKEPVDSASGAARTNGTVESDVLNSLLTEKERKFEFHHVVTEGFLCGFTIDTGLVEFRWDLECRCGELESVAEDLGHVLRINWDREFSGLRTGTFCRSITDDVQAFIGRGTVSGCGVSDAYDGGDNGELKCSRVNDLLDNTLNACSAASNCKVNQADLLANREFSCGRHFEAIGSSGVHGQRRCRRSATAGSRERSFGPAGAVDKFCFGKNHSLLEPAVFETVSCFIFHKGEKSGQWECTSGEVVEYTTTISAIVEVLIFEVFPRNEAQYLVCHVICVLFFVVCVQRFRLFQKEARRCPSGDVGCCAPPVFPRELIWAMGGR